MAQHVFRCGRCSNRIRPVYFMAEANANRCELCRGPGQLIVEDPAAIHLEAEHRDGGLTGNRNASFSGSGNTKKYRIACQPNRTKRGLQSTGEVLAVSCEACKATDDYRRLSALLKAEDGQLAGV